MQTEVCVLKDTEALSRYAANEFLRLSTEAASARGSFTVALSGGSTPKKLYALLANEADIYRARIPWNKIEFFFGDERFVAKDHPDSNYRMAHEAMLAHVGVATERIHRMRTEEGSAEDVAAEYEAQVRRVLGTQSEGVPRFDLVLLGMGADGHTASLFPSTAALAESTRYVVANWVEKFDAHRLTLTPPIINNAANIIFIAGGNEKADVLRAVLEDDDATYPARLIRPRNGNLLWLVDESAASALTRNSGATLGK